MERFATTEPLRIYADRSWLLPGHEHEHVTILCPFWGRTGLGSAVWPDYADALIRWGPEFLELTGLHETELGVYPASARLFTHRPELVVHAHEFADVVRAAGHRPVFFYESADTHGSVDPPFPITDAIVFRGSIFRSKRSPNEFALPGFHEDLLSHTRGELPLRRKNGRASVSFCGGLFREHPPANTLTRLRRIPGAVRHASWRLRGRHEEDLFVRAKAVDALLAQDEVATSIVVRESGGGGNWASFDPRRWRRVRREYVENMRGSDYVLCARGDGNWSIRLYETLSLGRIPVIVDTDLVLPYDFLVNWRDHCVWIERTEVDDIGAKVAGFHDRLTSSEFEELQHACRLLWEQYLSPLGFFRNFRRHFERA